MKNLHPQIIRNIEQSDRDGGLYLTSLKAGDALEVRTKNTLYIVEVRDGSKGQVMIKGHKKFCPVATLATIPGSTWGGSMIKAGFVGLGMHLEFHIASVGTVTTSMIQGITLNGSALLRGQAGKANLKVN